MKTIAKTTKPIMLLDPFTRETLSNAPQVITWTQFFESRTGKGEIKILHAELPQEATDEDFQKFLVDAEDEELAVASFVSQFEEKKPTKAKGRGKAKS